MIKDVFNIYWNMWREENIRIILERMSKRKDIFNKFQEIIFKFINDFERWELNETEFEFDFDLENITYTPLEDWRICKFSDEDIELLRSLWEDVDDNDYYLPDYEGQTYFEWKKKRM